MDGSLVHGHSPGSFVLHHLYRKGLIPFSFLLQYCIVFHVNTDTSLSFLFHGGGGMRYVLTSFLLFFDRGGGECGGGSGRGDRGRGGGRSDSPLCMPI